MEIKWVALISLCILDVAVSGGSLWSHVLQVYLLAHAMYGFSRCFTVKYVCLVMFWGAFVYFSTGFFVISLHVMYRGIQYYFEPGVWIILLVLGWISYKTNCKFLNLTTK